MEGARQYSHLFKSGQYGRLYIVSGSHARGKTFHIYVLPQNESAMGILSKHSHPSNPDAVEVYGVTSGNPGWTETYGWLHRGKWEDDFAELVRKAKADREAERLANEQARQATTEKEAQRINRLLADY